MAAEHLRRGEVQQRLGEAGWFSGLEPRLAEAVLEAGRQVSVARGASMLEPQGDLGGIYGVISGGIVISLPGRHGYPSPGHIMRRGEWFSYGAVLFRRSRTLLAEANEPSVLLHVPLAQVDAIRADIPGADLAFMLLAAFGETAILNVLADLMIPQAEQRLASVLLRVTGFDRPGMGMVHRTTPAPDRHADPSGVPLTQVLLADLANVSRQSAARFVDRATRAGWIDWRYGRVRILAPQDLAAFAAGA